MTSEIDLITYTDKEETQYGVKRSIYDYEGIIHVSANLHNTEEHLDWKVY